MAFASPPLDCPAFRISHHHGSALKTLRNPFFAAFVLFVAFLVRVQAAESAKPLLLDGIAAEVGGVRITIADVMDLARNQLVQIPAAGRSSAIREAYAVALTNLIERQLILQRYQGAQQKIPEWYLRQRVTRIVEDDFGGDRSRLMEMLNHRGLTYAAWSRRMEEEVIATTMRQQFIDQNIHVSPEGIRAAYEERFANEKLAGPVRVGMILLRPEGDESAEALLARAKALATDLQKGGDFAAAARKHSKEDHAEEGGDWGYIDPAEELREDLAKTLASLPVGSVSDPVAISDDYVYILRKADERPDLKVPFEYVRPKIASELRRTASRVRYREWIQSLRDVTTVRVFPLP